MSRFPQNLCVNSQCALDACLSSLSALVVCASAGVLRPTEMSCVRTWFHFPPVLSPTGARSLPGCAYKRARMDASTLPSQLQCYGGGHRDSDSDPESCSSSREVLARHGYERDKEIW